MIGFIAMCLPERHFGFIRYSSQQEAADPPLDQSLYFSDTNLQECVQVGDRVAFDIGEVNGKPRAANIVLAEGDRLHGVIESEYPQHQYCFIRSDDGSPVFCNFASIIPDLIGRRGLCAGTPVSFLVKPGGAGRCDEAFDVRNEDPALIQIDPATYLEWGRVTFWNGDQGYIERPSGDTICFLAKNIVTEGVEDVCRGLWLQYGVMVRLYSFREDSQRFVHRVFARDISVSLREERQLQMPLEAEITYPPGSFEERFLNAPELPPDELTTTKEVGEIYTPAECKLTLRQLIELQRDKPAA